MEFPPPSLAASWNIHHIGYFYVLPKKQTLRRTYVEWAAATTLEIVCFSLKLHKWPALPHNINSESCSLVRTICVSDYFSLHFHSFLIKKVPNLSPTLLSNLCLGPNFLLILPRRKMLKWGNRKQQLDSTTIYLRRRLYLFVGWDFGPKIHFEDLFIHTFH